MELNEKAPPFCLQDADDRKFCLPDAAGKWVVLYFYPKDDTPGCTLEAIDFTRKLKEFEEIDVLVLGISPDSRDSHCRFRDKHELKVTLLSDPEHRVSEQYGVWVEKNHDGKTAFGVERTTVVIDPRGIVRSLWPKVKVPGHIDAVLETVQKLKSA
jgi:thioredoxin-dependent peroxiredoxin